MKRLNDSSQILGGRSSQLKIDSSLRSEFGWGNHTAEACIITFDSVHSHSAVYISEDLILIILMPNPEAAWNYSSSKREEKYTVSFSDIMDIEIKLDPTLNAPESLHNDEKEIRRQSTKLFLRGGQGTNKCNKVILSLQQ